MEENEKLIDTEEKFIDISFSIDEMNVILKALSGEPFKDVYQIIAKINLEASNQLKDSDISK